MKQTGWENINSIIFVPSTFHKLEHIKNIHADAAIIDLEDSIKSEEKNNARRDLQKWLNTYQPSLDVEEKDREQIKILLRINKKYIDIESALFHSSDIISGIVLPKAERADEIRRLSEFFPEKEIMVLIETPRGMLSLEEILSMNEVHAVGFGGEDFCVEMEMERKEEYLRPVKLQLLIHSKSYKKPIYDMVEPEYQDREKFRETVYRAKGLGFSGKLAIHPSQVDEINMLYKNVDRKKILSVIHQYEANKSGFVMIDNVIYEKPHIERLKKMIGV